MRIGEKVVRGYERNDLEDAFARYVPLTPPEKPLQPLHLNDDGASRPADNRYSPKARNTLENAEKPRHDGTVTGVTVWRGGSGGPEKICPNCAGGKKADEDLCGTCRSLGQLSLQEGLHGED